MKLIKPNTFEQRAIDLQEFMAELMGCKGNAGWQVHGFEWAQQIQSFVDKSTDDENNGNYILNSRKGKE